MKTNTRIIRKISTHQTGIIVEINVENEKYNEVGVIFKDDKDLAEYFCAYDDMICE